MPYGPCIVCGKTNYPLSMGGPSICPSCDCGQYDGHVLAKHNAALQSRLAACQKELEEARRVIQVCRIVEPTSLMDISLSPSHRPTLHQFVEMVAEALAAYDKATKEG